MQVKRDITGGIMSFGVVITSIFAIMHSNLTEVNMNEVTIVENGERNTITTEAETVMDLITDGDVQFGNFDDFDVEFDDVVYDGMKIEIKRANPIIINDGGTRFQIMTAVTDVFEVLNEHNIELSNDDLVEITQSDVNSLGEAINLQTTNLVPLASGSTVEIEVTRISIELETKTHEFELETKYLYTDELLYGESEVRVEGLPQVEETVIESEYRNGEFYTVIKEETRIISLGKQQVIAVGTHVFTPPKENGLAITFETTSDALESFTASVTAYLATCFGCSGITANGTDVRSITHFNDSTFGNVRIIAADHRFSFGTIIYISGVGNAIVLDRGGAVTGDVLDLLVGANDNPWQFGRQALQAQVIRIGW